MTREELEALKKHIECQQATLCHNHELFDIIEGDLLSYVKEDLQKQLSPQNFAQILHRIAPINLLRRTVDKLSQIYSDGPTRNLLKPNKKDSELMEFYTKSANWNQQMNVANENFNTYKNTWIRPVVDRYGKPQLVSIPSDRFTVYGADPENPTQPTHLVIFAGAKHKMIGKTRDSRMVEIWHVYTDEEFIIIDSDLEIQTEDMAALKLDGKNPYETLPGVYVNRSANLIVPKPDSDTLKMTKLFPILLSDLNFAVMYQCFSIIYGIDVDDENIVMSPNAFWRFKTDNKGSSEKKPQVGVIKPQVDIDQVIGLIQAQLAMWLQSKNIRPGAVGQLRAESFSSGVSKMVDEMDTFEDRQKQVGYFTPAENALWIKIARNFHPYWLSAGKIDTKGKFSPNFEVNTKFVDQRPMFDRKAVLDEVQQEIDLRILDRKRAATRVNPTMSQEEIEQMLADVDAEMTVTMPGEGGQGGHTHEMPDGGQTGPPIDVGNELHTHSIPGGGETEPAADSPGHTHGLPDGGKTGPEIEPNGQMGEDEN